MKIGMVGLGRMGADMSRRLLRAGHQVVANDVSADAVGKLVADGATGADSLDALIAELDPPRAVWLMLPAGVTGGIVARLLPKLSAGDIVVDGGNSYYRDDVDRARGAAERGVRYLDCGTSGGVWGLERGYCLMIGGDDDAVAHLDPVFAALAPGVDASPRTEGRSGPTSQAEHGYLHCGPSGAGHFVKMVHNGIEYAIMTSYAEGFNILAHAGVGRAAAQDADAETTPLRDPEYYQYDAIDLAEVAEVWRRGSVVGSWLLDLSAAALLADPSLAGFSGRVSDSGEGRWTSIAAIDEGVPAPLLTTALYLRFASRGADVLAAKVQSAQRRQFGGHVERSG